jgi:hypothetical protein
MPDVLGTVQDLIASKGTQFFLSAEIPVLTGDEEDDVETYDALNWTEVGMIESIGDFGPDGTIGSFTPLGTGVACKFRGNTDYGELSLVVAKTLTDTGLLALIARQGNPAEASFKVALSEAGTAGAGMEPHRYYFQGLVKSARVTLGSGDDVVKIGVAIPITGDVLEGAAVNGTP